MNKEQSSSTTDNRPGGSDSQPSNVPPTTKQRQSNPYKSSVLQKDIFKGDTTDMNGHVFQTHSEQRKKNQFNDTLDALKTYVSQKYIKHIDYLMPLFVDLSSPSILMPTPSAPKVKKEVELKDGTTLEIPQMDFVEEGFVVFSQ